jgi:hypothetical protein
MGSIPMHFRQNIILYQIVILQVKLKIFAAQLLLRISISIRLLTSR